MANVSAIRFYANWCGPCKGFKPVWEKVEKELADKAKFISVDIDKDTDGLAAKYKIRSIPSVVILEDSELKSLEVGVLGEQVLKEKILF